MMTQANQQSKGDKRVGSGYAGLGNLSFSIEKSRKTRLGWVGSGKGGDVAWADGEETME